jgi:hypothetical protein
MKNHLFNFVFGLIIWGFIFSFGLLSQGCNTQNNNTKHDTIIKHDTVIIHDTITVHDTCHKTIINQKPVFKPKDNSIDRKPNIYIYPQKELALKVNITFPKGGSVIKSIPTCDDGWNINVETTGKIDKTYDYLFYESKHPDYWQRELGWFVEKDSLLKFFQTNMSQYGFNSKEIKDFNDYWIPRLTEFKYYLLYPQEKESIDKLVLVNYSVKPDKILRLYYVIKGTNEKQKIEKPEIKEKFIREGFYVTEWGVIL